MTSAETKTSPTLSGEARLSQRQKQFRTGLVATLVVGFFTGVAVALTQNAIIPPMVFWAVLAVCAVGMIPANIRFLRIADEVEVADNLWSSYIALQVHVLFGGGWYLAAKQGLAPTPNVAAVLLATLAVGGLAYVALKLRRQLG